MRDAAPSGDLVRWAFKTMAVEPGRYDTLEGALERAVQRERAAGWEVVVITRDGTASVVTIRLRRPRA